MLCALHSFDKRAANREATTFLCTIVVVSMYVYIYAHTSGRYVQRAFAACAQQAMLDETHLLENMQNGHSGKYGDGEVSGRPLLALHVCIDVTVSAGHVGALQYNCTCCGTLVK